VVECEVTLFDFLFLTRPRLDKRFPNELDVSCDTSRAAHCRRPSPSLSALF